MPTPKRTTEQQDAPPNAGLTDEPPGSFEMPAFFAWVRTPKQPKGEHMLVTGSAAGSAVAYALRGLNVRADVRAHNIANVNTPGFQAMRVDFESTLRGALRSGGAVQPGTPAITPDTGLPNPNNNTVSLESEMTGMMKDNLLRDAMVNTFNYKAGVLRAALGSR